MCVHIAQHPNVSLKMPDSVELPIQTSYLFKTSNDQNSNSNKVNSISILMIQNNKNIKFFFIFIFIYSIKKNYNSSILLFGSIDKVIIN